MFNALQPGVFALSGWDLAGMLTVDAAEVADLIAEGDTRWLNRGAHDLRGVDEPAARGPDAAGARSLYGTLPEQLADPTLVRLAAARGSSTCAPHGIATAAQIDVPQVSHKAELVMVHELDDGDAADHRAELLRRADHRAPCAPSTCRPARDVTDMFTGEELGTVDDLHCFGLVLGAYRGHVAAVGRRC